MHETENPNVLGYIDKKSRIGDSIRIVGWCMSKNKDFHKLRVKNTSELIIINSLYRADVCNFYNMLVHIDCGWDFTLPFSAFPCELEMEITNGAWETVFRFPEFKQISTKYAINVNTPSYIVIDNFYTNPDSVREFALTCDFQYHPNNHKGKRTDQCYRFDGLKERFEQIIGRKITNWEKHGTNGCFQYCIGGDQLVYHCDFQQYAGVLFLTPDAPVNTGTSLFRSIHTKKMKVSSEEHSLVFRNGFLDPSEFELVDVIGNVYNRLVLFDSLHIHAASEYFGNTLENGRLFQLFFFDLQE